jgi:hypothetical protein
MPRKTVLTRRDFIAGTTLAGASLGLGLPAAIEGRARNPVFEVRPGAPVPVRLDRN